MSCDSWVIISFFQTHEWLSTCSLRWDGLQFANISWYLTSTGSLKCTKICNYYIKAQWPKSNIITNLTFRRQINHLMRLKHFLLDFSPSLSTVLCNDIGFSFYEFLGLCSSHVLQLETSQVSNKQILKCNLSGNVGDSTEPVHKSLEHHQTTYKIMPTANTQGNIKYCKNISVFMMCSDVISVR